MDCSFREDDFFHLFNGDPHKRRHADCEENYNICNKSLEYLPSLHVEPDDRSLNQRSPNEMIYNDYYNFTASNKINYKIEEFLEIGSEETIEDSFIKDFPQMQESFSDVLLYWEYEEDDVTLVREIFFFNEWSQKEAKLNTLKAMQYQSNFSPILENMKKMAEFKSPWVEKVNLQISDIDLRYFLMGQIFKMLNEEHPMKIS